MELSRVSFLGRVDFGIAIDRDAKVRPPSDQILSIK
jgi:hypothetical protein